MRAYKGQREWRQQEKCSFRVRPRERTLFQLWSFATHVRLYLLAKYDVKSYAAWRILHAVGRRYLASRMLKRPQCDTGGPLRGVSRWSSYLPKVFQWANVTWRYLISECFLASSSINLIFQSIETRNCKWTQAFMDGSGHCINGQGIFLEVVSHPNLVKIRRYSM